MSFMRSSAGDLVYRLSGEEEIDDVSYSMLRNNAFDHLLPVALVREDGVREFRYSTEGMRIASSYVASRVFSVQQHATFLLHIVDVFEEAHSYMMPASGIAESLELIYIGSNLDVRMVYVPVQGIMANYGLRQCLSAAARGLEVVEEETKRPYLNMLSTILESSDFSVVRLRRELSIASGKGAHISNENRFSAKASKTESTKHVVLGEPVIKPQVVPEESFVVSSPDSLEGKAEGKKGLLGSVFGSKKDSAGGEDGSQKGGFSFFQKKGQRSSAVDVSFQIPGQEPSVALSSNVSKVEKQVSDHEHSGKKIARAPQDDARSDAQVSRFGVGYFSEGFGSTIVVGGEQVKMKADGPESDEKISVNVPAQIIRLSTGEQKRIDSVPFRIGRRNKMVDFYVPDEVGVSRVHAIIGFDGERFTVEDNASSNHTFVNGNELSPFVPVYLKDGDVIRLGSIEFRFLRR